MGLQPNLRVLVVEHNSIIALDVEDMLLRNGATRVSVAGDAGAALSALELERFDAALVNLHLASSGSLCVAERLADLGVPFAFVADFGDRSLLPPAFAARPVLSRPCGEHTLVARLTELLAPFRLR